MSDLDKNFRISPISAINMIYDVKYDLILQVSTQGFFYNIGFPLGTISALGWRSVYSVKERSVR